MSLSPPQFPSKRVLPGGRARARVGQASLRLFALVAVAVALAPGALAQDFTPVILERIDEGDLVADVGQPAVARFRLLSLNPSEEFFITVASSSVRHWSAEVDRTDFFLGPRNETTVTVTFTPADTPRSGATFEVSFAFVNGATGGVVRATETVEVASGAPPRVIGVFPNPLGPPLDNAYGTFLLDMAVWAVIGVASVVASNLVVRVATTRAKTSTTNAIAGKLRRPIFLFILLLGLSRSFAILPRNPVTTFITRFLVAIAVTVFGLYVLYRGLEAALVYYQREIAPKTATKMDDVLVPAFRKVGLVIIYIVGIILTLRTLGWDPTLVFAGAGIAGLVLAFAAQDTFSNLFSGVFLMIDRPFVEGDQIRLETGEDAIVQHIGLRTTRLYSEKIHETIIVPNNQLATKRIVNHHEPDLKYRIAVEVGVSYASDPRHVERVLLEVARAHPEHIDEGRFRPSVRFLGFQESAMLFAVRMYILDFTNRGRVSSDLRFAIVEAFRREGIEIPFPQRVVHVRNDAATQG